MHKATTPASAGVVADFLGKAIDCLSFERHRTNAEIQSQSLENARYTNAAIPAMGSHHVGWF
jgi:hypothetical protein